MKSSKPFKIDSIKALVAQLLRSCVRAARSKQMQNKFSFCFSRALVVELDTIPPSEGGGTGSSPVGGTRYKWCFGHSIHIWIVRD